MQYADAKAILDELHDQQFKDGVTSEDLAVLRTVMGRPLPTDYVEYLTKLGCGYASSEDFIGMAGEPHLDVIRVRERLTASSSHARLPDHFIPLRPDGFGNFDCIDLSRSTAETSSIVQWLHDGRGDQESEVIAIGFWNWFCALLESIREFDADGYE